MSAACKHEPSLAITDTTYAVTVCSPCRLCGQWVTVTVTAPPPKQARSAAR
jgi:hypothetical protein